MNSSRTVMIHFAFTSVNFSGMMSSVGLAVSADRRTFFSAIVIFEHTPPMDEIIVTRKNQINQYTNAE